MSSSRLTNGDSSTEVIAVVSGKGGVGKSTIAANLARSLCCRGYQVGIMDADIYGFTVPHLLGAQGRPRASEGKIEPLKAHGMSVMSMGFFVDDDTPVMWRGPMLMKAVDQFLGDVQWDADLDFLIIDLPPGTGDVHMTIAQKLPGASLLLVTLPEVSSVRVASRAGNMAERTNMSMVGVVENMSHVVCSCCGERLRPFGSGGGEILAQEMGVPLLAEIPLDTGIRNRRAGDELLVDRDDSVAGSAIDALAQRLLDELLVAG